MPICLNCEIELPAGTELCPHCNEPVEEEVETDAGGGILADAWDDEPLSFGGDDDAADVAEEPAYEEPAFEELPAAEPEELPAAAPEPAEDDAAARKAERERRKAERAAKKGDDGGDDKPKRGTSRREKTGKDKGGKTGKSGKTKTREAAPAKPAADVTLSQPRKVVAFAALTWLLFVALYGAAFTKGLLWGDESAAKSNMANVMFGVLGLASFLFLWAHLKMGRYISFSSIVVALGVECFFFFTGKENFGGLVGTGLFLFVQVLLLTGAGGIIRGFLSFVLVLLAATFFAIPHAVDVVLQQGAVAQETRARALKAGTLVYTKDEAGEFTLVRAVGEEGVGENDQRAEMPQVWAEFLAVAEKFDASEQTLKEFPASIGLDVEGWGIGGLFLKPRKREQILVGTVVPALFAVLRGDPNEKAWGMREWIRVKDESDTPPTTEETQAWNELSTTVTRRLLQAMRRYLSAEPEGEKVLALRGNVIAKVYPYAMANEEIAEQIAGPEANRFLTFHNEWKAMVESQEGATLQKLYFGRDAADLLTKVRAQLNWSANEATDTFNCIRRLGVLEATIRVEPPEDAPADGGAGEGGAGEGGGEGAGEGGAGEGGSEGGSEGGGDDGGGDDGGDDGGDEGGGEDG